MSQFLRDTLLKNLTLEEKVIDEINSELVKIRDEFNQSCSDTTKSLKLHYVIRFDQNGFVLYDFAKVKDYFRSAKSIERLVFSLISDEHNQSAKLKGKNIDLRFDAINQNNCFIIVQDDDQSWVDSILPRMVHLINKFANKNYLIRNLYVTFLVQILGVFLGILFSLWMAMRFSSNLKITNPFGFTFLIALVLFSNVWTYLYPFCLKAVDYFWPNIAFKERGEVYKICKALFFAAFSALFLGMFGWLFHKIFNFVASLFVK